MAARKRLFGTTDKSQAAIIAGPMILEHKAKLYAIRGAVYA
jgi:hypothetical protein